jgi:hypothetical protein
MKEFKETEFYEDIETSLWECFMHDDECFVFSSCNDHVFCFTSAIESPGLKSKFELCFICDDTIVSPMSWGDLMKLKRIEYFSLRVFESVGDSNETEIIEDLDWRLGDE